MKKPIKGEWLLYYDEYTLIMVEHFNLEENLKTFNRHSELPIDRQWYCNTWNEFVNLKESLNYPMDRSIPKDLEEKRKN